MNSKKVDIDLLFETSWEVCNKVGGIYTVLSTKANNLQNLYKDKVIFIGPDVWSDENPCHVFKESKTLLKKWAEKLELPYGIKVRVGRWTVPGKPIAVLVDFKGLFSVNNEFYAEMWQKFGVDSLHAYGDYDEASAFSHAAGIVIASLVSFFGLEKSHKVIAHFDEWTTGLGLLYVKDRLPAAATVFTTHATSIGRSICGNGKDLYRYFTGYDGDIMARELNMEAKHSVEKTAAHNADCFTTVSDITADECEQLLAKRPDIVTPNGFERNFVPAEKAFTTRRAKARKKLLEVAKALTGKTYSEDTFLVATSGRCEYRNKGLDMFIDTINELFWKNPTRDILAFVMVPAWMKEARQDIKDKLSSKKSEGQLSENVLTHYLHNPECDAVLNHIRNRGFKNNAEDKVHIMYVPCYLNGNDGIFDKTYYDLLIGLDATVFPSYYEPWGYTPLESIAFGVPTITTSLSGFGRWILAGFSNDIDATGVFVTSRNDDNYFDCVVSIADTLLHLVECNVDKKAEIDKNAMKTSQAAAWDYFIKYYIDSFSVAIKNARKRNKN